VKEKKSQKEAITRTSFHSSPKLCVSAFIFLFLPWRFGVLAFVFSPDFEPLFDLADASAR
jgi:hypothetical protein